MHACIQMLHPPLAIVYKLTVRIDRVSVQFIHRRIYLPTWRTTFPASVWESVWFIVRMFAIFCTGTCQTRVIRLINISRAFWIIYAHLKPRFSHSLRAHTLKNADTHTCNTYIHIYILALCAAIETIILYTSYEICELCRGYFATHFRRTRVGFFAT